MLIFNWVVWVVLAVWLAITGGIYWWTVYRQNEHWSLGAIRAGSFLGMAVTASFQVWWWFVVCLAFFILSLFSGQSETSRLPEGGDTVDNGSH